MLVHICIVGCVAPCFVATFFLDHAQFVWTRAHLSFSGQGIDSGTCLYFPLSNDYPGKQRCSSRQCLESRADRRGRGERDKRKRERERGRKIDRHRFTCLHLVATRKFSAITGLSCLPLLLPLPLPPLPPLLPSSPGSCSLQTSSQSKLMYAKLAPAKHVKRTTMCPVFTACTTYSWKCLHCLMTFTHQHQSWQMWVQCCCC